MKSEALSKHINLKEFFCYKPKCPHKLTSKNIGLEYDKTGSKLVCIDCQKEAFERKMKFYLNKWSVASVEDRIAALNRLQNAKDLRRQYAQGTLYKRQR